MGRDASRAMHQISGMHSNSRSLRWKWLHILFDPLKKTLHKNLGLWLFLKNWKIWQRWVHPHSRVATLWPAPVASQFSLDGTWAFPFTQVFIAWLQLTALTGNYFYQCLAPVGVGLCHLFCLGKICRWKLLSCTWWVSFLSFFPHPVCLMSKEWRCDTSVGPMQPGKAELALMGLSALFTLIWLLRFSLVLLEGWRKSQPFGLCLHEDLCPFSLVAPWFLLITRVTVWAEEHPETALAQLSFYSEGTVGQGLGPVITRGAGIRTWVLVLSRACLSRMASHIDGWVPENLPCAWSFRVPRVLALSRFILPAASAFPGFCPRRQAAVQVVLVAKACPTLDTECFSLYLIVHSYLNAVDIVCSAPLCDFWKYHWVPGDLASFQQGPQSWSGW